MDIPNIMTDVSTIIISQIATILNLPDTASCVKREVCRGDGELRERKGFNYAKPPNAPHQPAGGWAMSGR